MMKLMSFGCCLMLSGSVFAAIYKHVDRDGRTIYSSTPIKGAIKITTDPEEKKQEAMLVSKKHLDSQKKNISNQLSREKKEVSTVRDHSASTVHKIDATTQKARDKQRYDILENELGVELALRQKTQKNIARITAQATPNMDQLKTLEEDLRVHENNILALQKEMQRIK